MNLLNRIQHSKIVKTLFLILLVFTIGCSDKSMNGKYAVNFGDSIELVLFKDTFNVIKVVAESGPNTDMVTTWETLLYHGAYIVNDKQLELFNMQKERVCIFKISDGLKLICSNNFDNFVKNDTLICIMKYDKNNKEIWHAGRLNDSVTFRYYYKKNKVIYYNEVRYKNDIHN